MLAWILNAPKASSHLLRFQSKKTFKKYSLETAKDGTSCPQIIDNISLLIFSELMLGWEMSYNFFHFWKMYFFSFSWSENIDSFQQGNIYKEMFYYSPDHTALYHKSKFHYTSNDLLSKTWTLENVSFLASLSILCYVLSYNKTTKVQVQTNQWAQHKDINHNEKLSLLDVSDALLVMMRNFSEIHTIRHCRFLSSLLIEENHMGDIWNAIL